MLRSVGALIFGSLADRYGRKWPMIINLCAFIVLELGTGFTNNLHQFLGVRALYGIAMGGTQFWKRESKSFSANTYQDCSVQRHLQPWKTSHMKLAAFSPAFLNKDTQLGTYSRQSSTERSFQQPLTVGGVCSGSVRAPQF
jgi:MFS family permease